MSDKNGSSTTFRNNWERDRWFDAYNAQFDQCADNFHLAAKHADAMLAQLQQRTPDTKCARCGSLSESKINQN